jgi:hypothetical protein
LERLFGKSYVDIRAGIIARDRPASQFAHHFF